jgi:hypothetical protein
MKGIEEINMILFLNIMSTDDYIYTFVHKCTMIVLYAQHVPVGLHLLPHPVLVVGHKPADAVTFSPFLQLCWDLRK